MLTLAFALLLLPGAGARAQHVESVINRFTDLWARGDASAIAELSSRDGVTLDFDGRLMGPLGHMQVAAMLRRLFDDRETLSARMMTPQIVGGTSARAFGEVSW